MQVLKKQFIMQRSRLSALCDDSCFLRRLHKFDFRYSVLLIKRMTENSTTKNITYREYLE